MRTPNWGNGGGGGICTLGALGRKPHPALRHPRFRDSRRWPNRRLSLRIAEPSMPRNRWPPTGPAGRNGVDARCSREQRGVHLADTGRVGVNHHNAPAPAGNAVHQLTTRKGRARCGSTPTESLTPGQQPFITIMLASRQGGLELRTRSHSDAKKTVRTGLQERSNRRATIWREAF